MRSFLGRVAVATGTLLVVGCTRVALFLANAPAAFGSYDRIAGLAYGDGPRARLDLYVPKSAAREAAAGLPVIVFWYGGSWTNGKRADYRFVGAALAQRGFVVAIPDYRLHPDVDFPAFTDDGAQAVAWLQEHAREYGGDPERMVLMGHSAGAHTAAYLALNQDALRKVGAEPTWIRGLVGLAGPYTLKASSDFLRAIFKAPYEPADWQPVAFVDETDPPALLIHGGKDKTVDIRHTYALQAALEKAGVRVETEIYPDAAHTDLIAAFATLARKREAVLDRVARFAADVTAEKLGAAQ
jgi:acetyl esterase/lipase